MRLLVFCGTRKAIERFDMEPDWDIIVGIYPAKQREETLLAFRTIPGAKLAVDRSMIFGWRAPADTAVLFDPSWPFPPGSAESIQAAARVAHFPEWDIRGKTK